MVTGMADPQTEELISLFPLLEPSPEAVPLMQVLPWCPKRTSFVRQPWCTSQLGEGSSLSRGTSPQPCAWERVSPQHLGRLSVKQGLGL